MFTFRHDGEAMAWFQCFLAFIQAHKMLPEEAATHADTAIEAARKRQSTVVPVAMPPGKQ